jgi:hypothetical protein
MKNSLMIDNYTEEELLKMDETLVRSLLKYSITIKDIIREKMGDELPPKMILDLSKYL